MSKVKAKDKVYQAIREFMFDFNYPPSLRDISKYSGVASISQIRGILEQLREERKIDYIDGKNRTISMPGIIYMDVKENRNGSI